MKIELHILQNFPPSNLNRDDTGSPKDAEFGGYRRARISSQCLKRSIRKSDEFEQALNHIVGIRTKRSIRVLAEYLESRYNRDRKQAEAVAESAMRKFIGKIEDGITSVLFYVGRDELDNLADRINGIWDEVVPAIEAVKSSEKSEDDDDGKKKKGKKGKAKEKSPAEKALDEILDPMVKAYIKEHHGRVGSVDIALFGRMLAEQPPLNIDAACQVAHAISTNKVSMEFDYFTAVDDLNTDEETGAGMIGTVGFNSSCFYRYSLIDVDQLAENLGGNRELAREGVQAFIRGAIAAIPSGKQNSFAAQTPPSFVMAVVRENGAMPWSLVNAFEKPVRPTDTDGLVEMSIKALDRHWHALVDMYGSEGIHPFVSILGNADVAPHLQDAVVGSIEQVIAGVGDMLEREGEGRTSA